MSKAVARQWNTLELKTLIYNGAKEGTKRCADHLLEEAQKQAPRDTNALRESGKVIPTDSGYIVNFNVDSGRKTKAMKKMDRKTRKTIEKMGINPDEFNYAIIQHEDTTFSHPKGGNAHYLKNPLEKNKAMYLQWIEEAVGDKI